MAIGTRREVIGKFLSSLPLAHCRDPDGLCDRCHTKRGKRLQGYRKRDYERSAQRPGAFHL